MPCCSAKITLWAWLGAWTATRPWLYCLQAAAQAWTSTNLFETCQGTGCLPSSKFEYTCTTTCRYGLCTQNTPGQFMPRRPSSPRHKVKVIHVDPVSSAPRGQSSSPSTTACAAGADQYNERQPRRTAHYQLLQGNCLFKCCTADTHCQLCTAGAPSRAQQYDDATLAAGVVAQPLTSCRDHPCMHRYRSRPLLGWQCTSVSNLPSAHSAAPRNT
jgi:hypothetical protein